MDHAHKTYDAVIVGARIAGSATALQLARQGAQVLLLDATTFPSDTLSSHLLWSDGLAAFDDLGLLPAILATNAPPITTIRLAFGPHSNTAPIPGIGSYPPLLSVRRLILDDLLIQQVRQEPNITLQEGMTVQHVLREDTTVVGVAGVARAKNAPFQALGKVVIGADGRHSLIAQQCGAAEYDGVPPLLATYYRYYRGVEPGTVTALEAYRDADGGFCYLFPNDAGYWTLALSFPQVEFATVRLNHETALTAQIARKSGLPDRLANATAVTPWRGAGDLRNFFRHPYGPGWALVGDAGYQRDPITARGIPDALHSAALLSAALQQVWTTGADYETALASYQQTRDSMVKPLYDFTVDRPPAGVSAAAWATALGQTLSDAAYLSRYIGFMSTATPPKAFYSTAALGQ